MNNNFSKPVSRNSEFSVMKPVLKVVGMGGGGSNAINRMIELGLKGVDFIAVNTDADKTRFSKISVCSLRIRLLRQFRKNAVSQ